MNVYFTNIFNRVVNVLATAESKLDFYNQNVGEEGGGSILPFLGFMCSLFALVFLGIGIVRYIAAKKKYNMFFDQRDQRDKPDDSVYKKEQRVGLIAIIVGAILMVLSFVLL